MTQETFCAPRPGVRFDRGRGLHDTVWMQRTTPEGLIISCDFCGTDWDQTQSMIEGHHGSVLCLDCLAMSLPQMAQADDAFKCTLCLQEQDAGTEAWVHPKPEPSDGLNPHAQVCRACLRQAARAFHKDPDVDFAWDELVRTQAIRDQARAEKKQASED